MKHEISLFLVIASLLSILCFCFCVLLCTLCIFRSLTQKHARSSSQSSQSNAINASTEHETKHETNPSHSSQMSHALSSALSVHEHEVVVVVVVQTAQRISISNHEPLSVPQLAPTMVVDGEYDAVLQPDEFVVRGDDENDCEANIGNRPATTGAELNGRHVEFGEQKLNNEPSALHLVPMQSMVVEAHSFEDLHNVLAVPAVHGLQLQVGESSVLPPMLNMNGECSEGVPRSNDDDDDSNHDADGSESMMEMAETRREVDKHAHDEIGKGPKENQFNCSNVKFADV